jgi:hypothetical protein
VKTCNKCHVSKSETEYNKNSQSKDGFSNTCRECYNRIHRDRYNSSPEVRAMSAAATRKWSKTPAGEDSIRKSYKKYSQSEKGKKTHRKKAEVTRKKFPGHAIARTALFYMVKCGLVIPSSICEYCGNIPNNDNPLVPHHWKGYNSPSDWVDVKWVHRRKCHHICESISPENWPTLNKL